MYLRIYADANQHDHKRHETLRDTHHHDRHESFRDAPVSSASSTFIISLQTYTHIHPLIYTDAHQHHRDRYETLKDLKKRACELCLEYIHGWYTKVYTHTFANIRKC